MAGEWSGVNEWNGVKGSQLTTPQCALVMIGDFWMAMLPKVAN